MPYAGPADQGKAATICQTGSHGIPPMLWWDTAEECLQADAELLDVPCRPSCVGRHLVVWKEGERPRVSLGRHEPSPPSTLAAELRACYGVPDPMRRLLPPRDEDNPPLEAYAEDTLEEWAKDDAEAWLLAHDPELQEAL